MLDVEDRVPHKEDIDKENPEWTKRDFRAARSAAEMLPPDLLAVLPKRKDRLDK